MERRYYTRGDLLSECEEHERRFGISTEVFLAADRVDDDVTLHGIPRHDRAVWRSAAHEAERLRSVEIPDPRAA